MIPVGNGLCAVPFYMLTESGNGTQAVPCFLLAGRGIIHKTAIFFQKAVL